MQARTRRNRVAILVSMTLCLTSTCEMQGDRFDTLRSRAANTVFAAATGDFSVDMDVQDISTKINGGNSPYLGAEQYQVSDWWKASLSEYDGSLSLISYEAAYTEPDEPLTMTTAADSDSTPVEDIAENPESIELLETNESIETVAENANENSPATTAQSIPASTTTTVATTISEPAKTTTAKSVQAAPGSVVFYSSGYGHGVGMSQNGANLYAKYEGWTFDQILSFYYPGTTLVKKNISANEKMTVGGRTGDVLSILSQICYNEMGGNFSTEAIKAQAVAAYSFYLYNGYGSGMICKANPPQNVVDAVRSVLGYVVYYDNKPALTTFFASSGGATASCKDIFFGDIPYLVSVPVKYDDLYDPNYSSTKIFTASALKSKLESTYRVRLTGNPYDWIQLEIGDGGYVAYAVIGGQVRVKGNEFRNALGLRSPKFDFVYQS